jgi:hypothetical protein
MPRKKTMQPTPLESFSLLDRTSVEIRNWQTREIGRGKDKQFASEELDWQVLTGLIDDLMSANNHLKNRALAALVSNSSMERFLYYASYGLDERTGRRHGKAIREKYQKVMRIVGAVEYDSWQVHSAPSTTGL